MLKKGVDSLRKITGRGYSWQLRMYTKYLNKALDTDDTSQVTCDQCR